MDYNFDSFLEHPEFIEFNKRMSEMVLSMSHTMVGFNYTKDEILSTKFYFVFYGTLPKPSSFPIDELREDYDCLFPYYSKKHLLTKYLPGGGLTFAIKFDKKNRVSKGFYIRLDRENCELREQAKKIYSQFYFEDDDFEDGYGQYVMLHQDNKEYSQYVYLKDGKKLSNLCGIPFDRANSVELSAIKTDGSHSSKLIAIGVSDLISTDFYNNMPDALSNLNCKNLVCPAVNIHSKQYSIYNFSMFNPENNPNGLSNHVFI